MFIRSAEMLPREGVLASSRPDVYRYEDQQHEEYEVSTRISLNLMDLLLYWMIKIFMYQNKIKELLYIMIRYVFVLYHQIIQSINVKASSLMLLGVLMGTIVGTYDEQQHFGFVVPDDEHIGTDIFCRFKRYFRCSEVELRY